MTMKVTIKLMWVKVVYPLKQGLKPATLAITPLGSTVVKVVYPLKQGLKLGDFDVKVVSPVC